jgi:hypothetical protein
MSNKTRRRRHRRALQIENWKVEQNIERLCNVAILKAIRGIPRLAGIATVAEGMMLNTRHWR